MVRYSHWLSEKVKKQFCQGGNVTQYKKIMQKLYGNGSLTSTEARKMGIKNLRARVCELRDKGHLIMTHGIIGLPVVYKLFQRNDYYTR